MRMFPITPGMGKQLIITHKINAFKCMECCCLDKTEIEKAFHGTIQKRNQDFAKRGT